MDNDRESAVNPSGDDLIALADALCLFEGESAVAREVRAIGEDARGIVRYEARPDARCVRDLFDRIEFVLAGSGGTPSPFLEAALVALASALSGYRQSGSWGLDDMRKRWLRLGTSLLVQEQEQRTVFPCGDPLSDSLAAAARQLRQWVESDEDRLAKADKPVASLVVGQLERAANAVELGRPPSPDSVRSILQILGSRPTPAVSEETRKPEQLLAYTKVESLISTYSLKLQDALREAGITLIAPIADVDPFSPDLHERAGEFTPPEARQAGLVKAVYELGYRFGGTVRLRARVETYAFMGSSQSARVDERRSEPLPGQGTPSMGRPLLDFPEHSQ